MKIHERIDELMKPESKKEMAEVFGVTTAAIWDWRRGRVTPSLQHVIKICKYFNVSADWLLGLSDE